MNKELTSSRCYLPEMEKLPTDPETLSKSFRRYLRYHLGRFLGCREFYFYEALALSIRDRITPHWRDTWIAQKERGTRRAYYMSLEFLMGRALGNHLLNMGATDSAREAMHELALDLEEVLDDEPDAGLGNGGLGRLAACFLDSCATLKLPVLGYGIRYEYGMFRQRIENGYQIETPDHWLRDGHPWELERSEYTQVIHFGGHTETHVDEKGHMRTQWVGTHDVLAIPYDVPISGYRNNVVNTLRLWKATATDEFNLDEFNAGDYAESVAAKNDAEHISMVLYPNDASENGKELRLRQQYFLASASLKDVCRQWELVEGKDYSEFAKFNVFQMNDTHPTIAVAELMRILMDDKGLEWDQAWEITRATMAYTNHTLLPEALERWPVPMFRQLLPRLLDIIYEINAHFLREVSMRWPGDNQRLSRMSIIEEGPVQMVRMAWLAIVASYSVNGVAELHSELLKEGLFKDFYDLWPDKFNNKTNGVTPRRWIAFANPGMTALISEQIGEDWIGQLEQLEKLKPFAGPGNAEFQKRWHEVKRANKQRLADLVATECGVKFDPEAMFDVQVKRIHEYKRQLLNILHVIHLYNRIKKGDTKNWTRRCVLIGGKAAPGYVMAKKIIKLINNVADMVNNDPEVGDLLKVAFIPNYRVSSMEVIAPGTDLSEQISTAGKEASGTGNMKFMMSGAVTIGTYDGANIEILDAVGKDNFFLFGLHANEVQKLRSHYKPDSYMDEDRNLLEAISLLRSGFFNRTEPGIFDDVINAMLSESDPWMTLADFTSYVEAQEQAAQAYQDRDRWLRMSIVNSASSGFFSTDRTIGEYNDDIWKLKPYHSSSA